MPIPAALLLALLPVSQTPGTPPPDSLPPAVIEFGETGDRMTLPVTIAGAGPFPFIVDTGAERTVISRELARRLGLAPGRTVRMTAMTGRSDVGTVVIPAIAVGALGGGRIEAPALDAAHLGAAGLLGLDTLQGRALTIDFDARRMTVAGVARRRRTVRAAPDEIVVTAKSVFGQLVVTEASYQGVRVRVILDTGSAVSVGNLALRARVRRQPTRPIEMMSVTGAMLTADYTQLSQVRVGGVTFENLPIAFADAAPFARFGMVGRPALLLGMDALRLFRRVDVDFANREVRFALPKGARRL